MFVEELLLSDKLSDLIFYEKVVDYEVDLGIKMIIFEYKYNLGEIYNLFILCGMFIVEDRFKINEYVISIICMFFNVFFLKEFVWILCYVLMYYEILKGIGYFC